MAKGADSTQKMRKFYDELANQFRGTFGREMTAEERKFFALAEHATINAHMRDEAKKELERIAKPKSH